MIDVVIYNLSNLTRFEGRDARSTFWWYVLFLVVVQFVLGIIISFPMMANAMGTAFDAAQAGADPQQLQLQMVDEMADSMRGQIWIGLISGLVTLVLFVASFTRRLHDSGKPGWIAGIVVALFLSSQLMTYINLDSMLAAMRESMTTNDPGAMMASQQEMMSYGLLTWVAYLIVIIFGVFDSEDGPNKYGEKPNVA